MTANQQHHPVICFGQQPCGFFPRRFLYAKIATARRLQAEIGGEIVFFCHDSDHDFRETRTTLRHRKTGEPPAQLRLRQPGAAEVLAALPQARARRLARQHRPPAAAPTSTPAWVEAFRGDPAANVADFCLEMYRRMGLLDGIRVARSSDPAFRRAACDVDDFFVDVPLRGRDRAGPVRGRRPQAAQGGRPVRRTSPPRRSPASRSARRATPACAGCNR